MPFGVHRLPFRVKLAGLSLLGLSAAAALPSLTASVMPGAVDPITTASVDKPGVPPIAAADEPLPEPVDAAAGGDRIAPVRQVLPESAQPVLSAPVAPAAAPTGTPMVDAAAAPAAAPAMADMQPADAPVDPVMDATMLASGPLLGSAQAPAVAGGAIVLALDHARVMRVVGDIGTIIIGNPAIADAAMPDPRTIILTGKSYGETNMVMLDAMGEIVAEQTLRVTVRGESTVSVFRGAQRTTLSCAPTCEISPAPGDTREALEEGLSAFDARNSAARNAAAGAQ